MNVMNNNNKKNKDNSKNNDNLVVNAASILCQLQLSHDNNNLQNLKNHFKAFIINFRIDNITGCLIPIDKILQSNQSLSENRYKYFLIKVIL